MIVEYIRYSVSGAERGTELVAAYTKAAAALEASPECLGYELAVCEEDATAYVLRIEWRSAEGHMQGFRKGPHFPAFFQAIGGFLKEITEMRHYGLTAVRSAKDQ
ncbi:MAG: antibiotic biosynthesis monooxygenase [Acidobacteriota bacterium]|nr:antibiotic biosynthesis monooxygenase [Acidobacteriota bacterium]